MKSGGGAEEKDPSILQRKCVPRILWVPYALVSLIIIGLCLLVRINSNSSVRKEQFPAKLAPCSVCCHHVNPFHDWSVKEA